MICKDKEIKWNVKHYFVKKSGIFFIYDFWGNRNVRGVSENARFYSIYRFRY